MVAKNRIIQQENKEQPITARGSQESNITGNELPVTEVLGKQKDSTIATNNTDTTAEQNNVIGPTLIPIGKTRTTLPGAVGKTISYSVGNKEDSNESDSTNSSSTETTYTSEPTGVGATAAEPTEAGATAAEGTQYSWDKKATTMAQNQYQQDVLAKKQEALTNRQTLESNAQAYQQQSDMMKYTQQQAAEKVGWAGGYVLDQNRQMDYLKASIQAQMYGAMELQKYGYDSALAAARLSYDLNQQQFAQQYYEQAVTQALSEAQLTGTYFSAETKDMMAQLGVADQILKDYIKEDGTVEIPDDASQSVKDAYKISTQINDWFEANGVSKAGVKTLAAWQAEESNNLAWTEFKWSQQQAALQSTKQDLLTDPDTVIKVDKEGNTIFKEDGTVETFSFSSTNAAGWIEYGNTSDTAKQQVYGHIESIANEAAMNYANSVRKGSGDSATYNISEEDLKAAIKGEVEKALGDKINDELFKDLKIDIAIGNNTTIADVSLTDIKDGTYTVNTNEKKPKTGTSNDALGSYNFGSLNTKYTLEKIRGVSENPSKKYDDDIDVTIGDKNYNLDIDWYGGNGQGIKDETQFNTDKAAIRDLYPNITEDDFVVYNGRVWFYSSKRKTWGVVQTNTGGNRLYDDLQYAKESGEDPERWKRWSK